MDIWDCVASAISDATRHPFRLRSRVAVGGGSINEAYRLEGSDGSRYFAKINDASHHAMFVAEAAGLDAISATGTVHVPKAIADGIAGGRSYLVLEHLELRSRGNSRALGERLAALHRCSRECFGFVQDNFIGTTAQPNNWSEEWITFWREQRLGFQLRLAEQNGHGGELQRLGARLQEALPAFFEGYTPRPSLLHGDLWSGNHGYLTDGTPAIFDPAVYYGDRECDLAMTELFGGYPAEFYAAYREAWPLDPGYQVRRDLYNLYHLLNHANLFGGGYARQSEQVMRSLLAELA